LENCLVSIGNGLKILGLGFALGTIFVMSNSSIVLLAEWRRSPVLSLAKVKGDREEKIRAVRLDKA
jgi:hypothetical protein